ncbi:MAG: hypothetical protein ACOC47_01030 [Alkalispirochaetaceae bacterium]
MGSDEQTNDFAWRWRDPSHLDAHRSEFFLPPQQVLELLRPLVAPLRPDPMENARGEADELPFHEDFELDVVVGESGLREVAPDGSQSFWAYRLGRTIPSHLCLGDRVPTKKVCLWGAWKGSVFVIHTLYPGRRAPREIHDPQIRLEDLPAAIQFWSTHAIITKHGSYSHEPDH